MIQQNTCRIGLIAGAIAASMMCNASVRAGEVVVALQGEITSINDTDNWFNNSFVVGAPIGGTYNFFDAGYELQISPTSAFYRYYLETNFFGLPVLPVSMNLASGGNAYRTSPGPFFYGIDVVNNSDGSGFSPAGDSYAVQSPLAFPANFTDLSGDPVLDPDFNFFPILGMSFRLIDPSGTALSSNDLPLTAPNLSSFSSAVGTIFIDDGNGEPDYAEMRFRITSIQVVPEPGILSVLAVGMACVLMRQRGRQITTATAC